MQFSYGHGVYIEKDKHIEGVIILSDYKLFLKGEQGDLTSTYVPLDKIERIRKVTGGVEIYVRPSLAYRFVSVIKGSNKNIGELIKDLVKKRQLKKRFLLNEWTEEKN